MVRLLSLLSLALAVPRVASFAAAPIGASARPAPRPRLAAAVRAQQGPLEEGFKELMPMATDEGNVDPELVAQVDAEIFALNGVGLEDLLNPSKVVNYERERIMLEKQISAAADAQESEELRKRLDKIEKQLYSEKRTVFAGWLKAVFVGQALLAIVLGGVAAFDAFPLWTIDISLQALGFWSFWLFVIPSLRARRPRGWEKLALDIAFLGSPLLTIGVPLVAKDPPLVWCANLALLVGCYGYGYAFGRGEDAQSLGRFGAALNAVDFGSGQERGIRGAARERYFERQRTDDTEGGGGEGSGGEGGGGAAPEPAAPPADAAATAASTRE